VTRPSAMTVVVLLLLAVIALLILSWSGIF
jgi:hypothetical protein